MKQIECTINPLSAHRHAVNESLVINNENSLDLAPGKYRETRWILFDEECEKLKENLHIIFHVNTI